MTYKIGSGATGSAGAAATSACLVWGAAIEHQRPNSSGSSTIFAARRAKSPHIVRCCCSGPFHDILSGNIKRRKAWPGRRQFWLKSALVSKSTATCQLTATCHPNSNSHFQFAWSGERSRFAGVRIFMGYDLSRQRKRKKCIVIPGDGDPCPRCGNPMQIREYAGLNEKQERRPFFYTRWFCRMNKACKTTLVMPARYKVVTNDTSRTDEVA